MNILEQAEKMISDTGTAYIAAQDPLQAAIQRVAAAKQVLDTATAEYEPFGSNAEARKADLLRHTQEERDELFEANMELGFYRAAEKKAEIAYSMARYQVRLIEQR